MPGQTGGAPTMPMDMDAATARNLAVAGAGGDDVAGVVDVIGASAAGSQPCRRKADIRLLLPVLPSVTRLSDLTLQSLIMAKRRGLASRIRVLTRRSRRPLHRP